MPQPETTDDRAEIVAANNECLRRAVAARLGTTTTHGPQHIKALDLIDTAFPELANHG